MEFNYNLFWGFLLKGCEIIGKVSWNVHKNLASSCVRFKQILKSYFGHISNYGFVWCYFTTNISRSCVLTVVMCELEKEDFWNQMTFLLSWAHFRSSCAVIYNFLYKVYIGQLYFSNILGRNLDQSFYNIQRWLSIILFTYVIVLCTMLIWFVIFQLWTILTILIRILQNIKVERQNTRVTVPDTFFYQLMNLHVALSPFGTRWYLWWKHRVPNTTIFHYLL